MRKGFTLVELLVVIAIIAILAALLFPVFNQARDAAKTAKCLAHGQELGKASMMYMDDWNGRFPCDATRYMPEEMAKIPDWHYNWLNNVTGDVQDPCPKSLAQYHYVSLKRYVRNDDIWICPTHAGKYSLRYAYYFRSSWLPRTTDDFVDGDRGFWDSKGVGLTQAEVQTLDADPTNHICGARYMPPTKKILWMCYGLGKWAITGVGNAKWQAAHIFPDYPHNGGSVYVYVDGHAKWQTMGEGWAPARYTVWEWDVPQH